MKISAGRKIVGMIDAPIFNSKIKSSNPSGAERWLGYLLGPSGVILLNAIMSTYLNVFYTDVLKVGVLWGGLFLTLMPIFSKIVDAILNIIMGQIVDKTHTRQGKARPWLIISAPLILISAILLFCVPQASTSVQVIWIIISYNFYFGVAYTCYGISHSMMVPLSTRNTKHRDGLAVISNMSLAIIPGMFVALLFPALIVPVLGVDQTKWITMIAIFSIIAMPCIMLEYFFTRERITEEGIINDKVEKEHTLAEQIKACLSSKYWVIIMIFTVVVQLRMIFMNLSLVYYCNWVLGTYSDGITQTLVSAIGNAPLGIGIVIMWPLVKKLGKRSCMIAGLILSVLGGIVVMISPTNLAIVLIGCVIRAFGTLPLTYITTAMLADALDHVEWKSGFRCDGFSMGVFTVITTVSMGVGTGLFNLGLANFGYAAPYNISEGVYNIQNSAVKGFITFGYAGLPIICDVIIVILMLFYVIEKHLPQIRTDIIERHRAEAEAEGREYVSPEEIACREQEEEDRIAEEKRIGDLKIICERKGLDFTEEEKKYQDKLAKANSKKKDKK